MTETRLNIQLVSKPILQITQAQTDELEASLTSPVSFGTKDYNRLDNKPRINDVLLKNNKTLGELGIQPAGNYPEQALTNLEIENLIQSFS